MAIHHHLALAPRRQLAHVLTRIGELSRHYGLPVANVFHAGDGNLHPLVLYDANIPGQLERAEEFGNDMLRLGAVKIILDGVWGTTAAVYKPFWNGSGTTFIPDNVGGTSRSQEQLTAEVVAAYKAGWQVEVPPSVDDLREVSGVGERRFGELSALVTV